MNTGFDGEIELGNSYNNDENGSKVSFSLNLKDKKNSIIKSIKSKQNIEDHNEIHLKNYFFSDKSLTVVTQAQHYMNSLFLSKYNELNYSKCDLSKDVSLLNRCVLVLDSASYLINHQAVTLIEKGFDLLEKKNTNDIGIKNNDYISFSEKDIVSYDNSIENELLTSEVSFSDFEPICNEDLFYSDFSQGAADISEIGVVNKDFSKKVILQLPIVSNKIITADCKVFFATGSYIGSGGYSVGSGIYSIDLKEEKINLKKIPLSDNSTYLWITQDFVSHEIVAYSSTGNLYFFKDIANLQAGFYYRKIFLEVKGQNVKIGYSPDGDLVMTDFKNSLFYLKKGSKEFNIIHLDESISDFFVSKKGILIVTISNIVENEKDSFYLLNFLDYNSFNLDERKEHLISIACKVDYGRNMSINEWKEFMGNLPYVKACDNWHVPDEKSINLRN